MHESAIKGYWCVGPRATGLAHGGSHTMNLSKSLGTVAAVATIVGVTGSAVYTFMQGRLDAARSDYEQLKDGYDSLKIERDRLKADCDRLENDNETLKPAVGDLQARLADKEPAQKRKEAPVMPRPATSPADFIVRIYHDRTSSGGIAKLDDLKDRLNDKGFRDVEIIKWKKSADRREAYFGNDLAIDVVPKKRKRVYYPSEAEPVLAVLKEIVPAGNRKYIERGKSTKQYELEGSKLDGIIEVIIPP
ncbi:MAG: hypothetical protein GY778_05155 [bacterium]|nr:hypothetical protein [bacterium]